jgi:hypothetical protein
MSIYKTHFESNTPNSTYIAITKLLESPIYGSSRVGVKNHTSKTVLEVPFDATPFARWSLSDSGNFNGIKEVE